MKKQSSPLVLLCFLTINCSSEHSQHPESGRMLDPVVGERKQEDAAGAPIDSFLPWPEVSSYAGLVDVPALIKIERLDQVPALRDSLIDLVWKGEVSALSEVKPSSINEESDLRRIFKWTDGSVFRMEYNHALGFQSTAFFFLPDNPKPSTIIYHHGHGQTDAVESYVSAEVRFFLERGYSVLSIAMPLKGLNGSPVIHLENLGPISFPNHNSLQLLESTRFHPLILFLEPIASFINRLTQNFKLNKFAFVGLSGGGWAATVYSALDERIGASFPVAGTLPIFLRRKHSDWGDWEQFAPNFYQVANYLELYILGSVGTSEPRKQLQILNIFDPCCFAGVDALSYAKIVQGQVAKISDSCYSFAFDDSHQEHKISEMVLNRILKELTDPNCGEISER